MSYIVINLVGQILGEFDTENEAHEYADGLKCFCYVEERRLYENWGFSRSSLARPFQIFATDNGFMAYDHDCDEYLYDENGDNCFDGYSYAMELVNDAIATVQEHAE